MITSLIERLSASATGNGLLDVDVHAALTGEMCLCKEPSISGPNHDHGVILREGGGEMKWRQVPRYTTDFDAIAAYFFGRGWGMKVTSTPEAAKADIVRSLPPSLAESFIKRWHVSAVEPATMKTMGFGMHDGSAALCATLVALLACARPADALDCGLCLKYFVPTPEHKHEIRGMPMCVPCMLALVKEAGNG